MFISSGLRASLSFDGKRPRRSLTGTALNPYRGEGKAVKDPPYGRFQREDES
jgi:hypothetical protein